MKCAIKSLDELSHGGNALSGISPLPSPGACQDVSCTQVDATTLPVTSLRAVLSRVFEKGPNLEEAMEFVCRVRVLGHSPQQVKDFARPVQIPGCGERLALYVRFHAEDPTGLQYSCFRIELCSLLKNKIHFVQRNCRVVAVLDNVRHAT